MKVTTWSVGKKCQQRAPTSQKKKKILSFVSLGIPNFLLCAFFFSWFFFVPPSFPSPCLFGAYIYASLTAICSKEKKKKIFHSFVVYTGYGMELRVYRTEKETPKKIMTYWFASLLQSDLKFSDFPATQNFRFWVLWIFFGLFRKRK